MPLMTNRHATAVRTLAGTVLTAALLVPAATACSSTTSGATGAAASTPPAATATTAPASAPATQSASAPAAPTGAPATAAHRTTAPPAATAKPGSPVRTQTLPDGSTVEIRETSPQHYTAKLVHGGQVLATLEAGEHDAGLDANDMFIVLSLDGQVHAWMGDGHQGPGTFTIPGGWTAKVTKTGELHYRAQIIGHDNAVAATLEADGHDVGLDANGSYIVLTAGGEISGHM